MPKQQSLGERIGQARREMGVRLRRDVTQTDVAKAIGVSGAAVSQWEADERAPREAVFEKLAAFLGVTPAFLRYGVPSGVVLDRLAKDEERSASELLDRKTPKAKGRGKAS